MPSIQIEQNENQALIQLQEPLTSALARELRPRLLEVIAKGATQMVMDLSLVDLVDSGGIGLLIATRNSTRQGGGRHAHSGCVLGNTAPVSSYATGPAL